MASDDGGRTRRGVRIDSTAPLLLTAVAVPLVVSPGVYFPYTVPRTVFFRLVIVASVGLFPAAVLTHRSVSYDKRDRFFWALWAFVGASLAAALAGVSPLRSIYGDFERLWGVATWVSLAGFYLLLRSAFDEAWWRRFLRGATIVGGVVSAYAIAQYHADVLRLPVFGRTSGRVASTLGNAGYLSAYLVLVGGVTAHLLADDRNMRWRRLYAAALPLIGYAFVLSGTRSAMLGVALGAAVAAVWCVIRSDSRTARWIGACVLAVITASGLLVTLAPTHPVVDAVGPLRRLAETTWFDRVDQRRWLLWSAAVDQFGETPLLGVGREKYERAFSARFPPDWYRTHPGNTYADRAHNAFLGVLATSGLIGFAAYAAVWITLGLQLLRAARDRTLSMSSAASLFAAIVAYVTYLLFWFEDLSSFTLLIALAAFIGHRANGRRLVEVAERGEPRRRALGILVAATLVLGIVGYRHGVQVLRAAHARDAATEESPGRTVEDRLAAFERVVGYGLPEADDALVGYVEYLQAFTPELASLRRDPYRLRRITETTATAFAALDRAIRSDPTNDLLHLQRGSLAMFASALSGDPRFNQSAVESLERAIELAPTRIRYHHFLAENHRLVGRTDRAVAVLERALSVYDGFGETYYFLGLAHHTAGDRTRAGESLERSIRLGYRRDPEFVERLGVELAARGERRRAAALYALWLDEIHDGFVPDTVAPRAPRRLGDRDRGIAARLPLLWLRANEPERAAATAARLALLIPEHIDLIHAFIREVRAGRTESWLDRAAIVPIEADADPTPPSAPPPPRPAAPVARTPSAPPDTPRTTWAARGPSGSPASSGTGWR